VRAAGLAEARKIWCEPPYNFGREAAAAVAIGRRLLIPLQAWGEIDPLALGLAEYQDLLNTERLRNALHDRLHIARHRHKTKLCSDLGHHADHANTSAPAKMTPHNQVAMQPHQITTLNPLVRQISDLRPGMQLQGLVANITDFGVFVYLGLPEEGLIHISELSDKRIKHPSEIVSIGQKLSVRVLSVDLAQQRIALSIRQTPAQSSHSRTQHKARALQQLDQLFKK
jgi:transcriptional accessory protein Tex/SPT6